MSYEQIQAWPTPEMFIQGIGGAPPGRRPIPGPSIKSGFYYPFEQTAGDWIDSVAAYHLPRAGDHATSAFSADGIIAKGFGCPTPGAGIWNSNGMVSGPTLGGGSAGITAWFWFWVDAVTNTVRTLDLNLSSQGFFNGNCIDVYAKVQQVPALGYPPVPVASGWAPILQSSSLNPAGDLEFVLNYNHGGVDPGPVPGIGMAPPFTPVPPPFPNYWNTIELGPFPVDTDLKFMGGGNSPGHQPLVINNANPQLDTSIIPIGTTLVHLIAGNTVKISSVIVAQDINFKFTGTYSTNNSEVGMYGEAGAGDIVIDNTVSFAPSTWAMLGFVWNKGAQTGKIYVNGVLTKTGAVPAMIVDTGVMLMYPTTKLAIGETMRFDECGAAFNYVATDANMLALYNSGAGLTWPAVATIVPFG